MQSAFFPAQQGRPEQQQQQQQGGAVSTYSNSSSKHAAVTQHTSSPVNYSTPSSSLNSKHGSGVGIASSRALRFPSSRRYLWDRTAAGPQVLVDLLDYLPHVQVAASTFGAICRAVGSKAGSLTLQLDLSVSPTKQVTALIQELDPLSGQRCLQLSCALTGPGTDAADADRLSAAMQAHLDQRDIARVQQLYVLAASATATALPGEATSLRLQLLMPRVGLLVTPLYTKRLCHVPLAEALLKPGCMAAGQTGYLSMDQARSLLPVEATDANVYSTPLVGVWVKGPSSVLHPLVAAACLRFAYSSLLMDRALNPDDGAFLLLLCPEGDPVSQCFEVHMTDNSKLELCCYRCEAGVRPAAGLSQFPGGLVSATWVPEQRTIQPLPGAGSTITGTAGRPGGHTSSRRLLNPPAAAMDSPILHGHSHASKAAAAELPLGRSSAPSATFGWHGAGRLQHGAAADATRRSLPLPYYGHTHSSSFGAVGDAHRAAQGLSALYPEEPQPRANGPAVPYVPMSQSPGCTQPWQQQQRQQQPDWGLQKNNNNHNSQAQYADASASAGYSVPGGSSPLGPGAVCSSPSKSAARVQQQQQQAQAQVQLTWSDRQDQVLRSSLEGAAEALRSSQASLAAARDAASGASSRLSSPTKGRSNLQDSTAGNPGATAAVLQQDAGASSSGLDPSGQVNSSAAAAAVGVPEGAHNTLSRFGNQLQQQQHADVDAESDCGPRMGSPVRASMHKKGSMLAAAAAHAAGVSAAGPPPERPVSPAVQAGVALSNLSLLQHLSSGQLQQALESSPSPPRKHTQQLQEQQGEQTLDAVAHAAVAASACSPRHATRLTADAETQQAGLSAREQQLPPAAAVAAAGEASPSPGAHAGVYSAAAQQSPPAAAAGVAVTESFNASHAASAAAMRPTGSSLQRVPVHPSYSHSLGVQRYAADVAVMHASSQGSPSGPYSLLSPGSSPGGMHTGGSASRWQPLHQQQQQQLQQQGLPARVPPAWSPVVPPPAPASNMLRSSSLRGSPYWDRPQQQQQQVSPMSVGQQSPGGWVADPVAQALHGEVERLRQQLQQLQHQLKLAGMSLRGAELDAAGAAAALPPAQPPPPSPLLPLAAAGLPYPGPMYDVVHTSSPQWLVPQQQQQQQPQQQQQQQQQPAPLMTPAAAGAGAAAANNSMAADAPQAQAGAAPASAAPAAAVAAAADLNQSWRQSSGGQQQEQQQQQLLSPQQQYPAVSYAMQPAGTAGQPQQQPGASPVAVGLAEAAPAAAAAAAGLDASAGVQTHATGMADTAKAASSAVNATSAYAAAPDVSKQQSAGQPSTEQQQLQDGEPSAAARQRGRRKLDFDSTTSADSQHCSSSESDSQGSSCGADASGPAATADAVKPPHSAEVNSSSDSAAAGGRTQQEAAAPQAVPPGAELAGQQSPAAAAGEAAKGPSGQLANPVVCSSPAATAASGAAEASKVQAHAAAGVAGVAAAAAAGGAEADHNAASARSSAADVAALRYSVRSSAGGLSHLRVSLDAPPLVEVVRARVVELSDDDDSDEDWEDRLLVKYGLK